MMANLTVELIKLDEQIIYGLCQNSNDKSVATDVNVLSEKYYKTTSFAKESVLPYFVVSKNYNQQNGDFEMFIGSPLEKEGLEKITLPAGKYAKITIKPKWGFLWGMSIGEAKRYFYTRWLPKSPYQELNMEYEFHTEKSREKHPTLDIMFAIQPKS